MFKVNSLPWFVFVYLDWKLKNELRLKNNTHSGMNKDILHNSFHGMDSHLYKISNLWSRMINKSDLFKGSKTLGPDSMGHTPWTMAYTLYMYFHRLGNNEFQSHSFKFLLGRH